MNRSATANSAAPLTSGLRRHWGKMLLVFATVMGLDVAYTALSPLLYTSEAKLFVRVGRETVALDPTATTGKTVNLLEAHENELNSVYELLKSHAIAEQLVDTFGINALLGKPEGTEHPVVEQATIWTRFDPLAEFDPRDKAIRKVLKSLKVDTVRRSNVINVSYEAPDPDLAQKVVGRAIDLAREMHTKVNQTPESFEFFATQTEERLVRLGELESQLRDLKNKTGVASVDSQREILLKRIADLEQDQRKARASLRAAEAEAEARRQALAALPATLISSETTGHPQTAAARMREQLYALELKEKELAAKYKEDTFFVQQVRDQIAQARSVLAEESDPVQKTKSLNEAHQRMHSSLLENDAQSAGLRAEIEILEHQLAEARTALVEFNDSELKIAGLSRQLDLEKSSFGKFAENRELSRIDRAIQENSISNLNLLQPPTHSITPSRPRVMVNLSLGIVLAGICAFGVAAVCELRSQTPSAAGAGDEPAWMQAYAEQSLENPNGKSEGGGSSAGVNGASSNSAGVNSAGGNGAAGSASAANGAGRHKIEIIHH